MNVLSCAVLRRATCLYRFAGTSQRRTLFSIWDRVHPSCWYPMAALEQQSMMEMDRLANRLLGPPFPSILLRDVDDDFFKDLPGLNNNNQQQPQQQQSTMPKQAPNQDQAHAASHKADEAVRSEQSGDTHAFSCYSYSTSTIIDKQGRRVATTRRRYEDSQGRLKAAHEREVDGTKLTRIWQKTSKDDQGQHQTMCSAGSAEDFENLWQQTAFGQAEQQQQVEEGDDKHKHHKNKKQSLDGQGKKQHQQQPKQQQQQSAAAQSEKTREQVIEEQSKRQAEETTPMS